MSRKLKKELRERWPVDLNFQINRGLKKENWKDKNTPNTRWGMQPFGLTKVGKTDLRGFSFREPLHYNYIVDIDFSYSQVISGNKDEYGPSRGMTGFINSIFEGCNFIDSEMPANLSEKFTDCDFSGAVFEYTRISADFNSCHFVMSKMRNVLVNGKKFVNCDFTKSNLSKSNFYTCYFENCIFDDAKFSGSNISSSTFVNTRPSDDQIASCSVADKLKFL